MNSLNGWILNLRILWVGEFLATAGLTVMVPFLPFYMEELGASSQSANQFWSGLTLAAPAFTLGLASPLWGRLGDRWGRKWMVVRALFGLAVSMVLMSVATTPIQFLLCRLFQGACGGVLEAAAAFAGAEAPAEVRGRALGNLQSATAAGSLTGPLVGGLITDLWGFRPLLLATGILTGASGILATWVLHESRREPLRSFAPLPLHQTLTAVLRHRQVRAIVLGGLCAQAGVYGIVTVFAPQVRILLQDPEHAATWVGILQAVTWSATLIGAPWWGRYNDRNPVEHTFALAAWGCALSLILQAWPSWVGWLFPLRVLQGFCFGAIKQSVYLRVSREAGAEQQGVQIGMANSFLVAGQILGALTGALVSGLVSLPWVFVLMGSFFGLGAILVQKTAPLTLTRGVAVR